jgi:sulfotransferase
MDEFPLRYSSISRSASALWKSPIRPRAAGFHAGRRAAGGVDAPAGMQKHRYDSPDRAAHRRSQRILDTGRSIIRPIHFISGLPRSGSTLLSALLKQNPRFHAGMSGPLSGMVSAMHANMSAANEYAVFISQAQKQRILRGVIDNYYGAEYPAEVIFDTNRFWCARMALLDTLLPHSRVIACVRNVSWIVDSIERLVRRNALSPSAIFNYQTGGTVYSRAEALSGGEGMVGNPYNALREAFYGEHAGKLLLVQYETLAGDPQKVLDAVYGFIGEPRFAHDFDDVRYDADEFDQRAGTPGLHAVRQKVGSQARDTILPPDVFNRFANDAFWLDPQANLKNVGIV